MVREWLSGKDGTMQPAQQLRRPVGEAPLAGVCAAVARHTNTDPMLVRVAAVLLALSSGVGLVLYALGWLLIPRAGQQDSILARTAPRLAEAPAWVFVCLGIVGVGLVAMVLGSMTSMNLLPVAILAAVWYFGVHRPRRENERRGSQPPTPPPPAPQTPTSHPSAPHPPAPQQSRSGGLAQYDVPNPAGPHPAGPTGASHADLVDSDTLRAGTPPTAPDPYLQAYLTHPDPAGLYSPTPPRPLRRSPLPDPQRRGKRVLGFTSLVTIGLVWLLLASVNAQTNSTDALWYPLSALMVTSLALVVGAWVGRPRFMLAGTVLLAGALGITATQPAPSPTLTAQNFMSPSIAQSEVLGFASVDELPEEPLVWDAGDAVIDLSSMADGADGAGIEASMGLGSLVVVVPSNYEVHIDGQVQTGSATVTSRGTTAGDAPAESRESLRLGRDTARFHHVIPSRGPSEGILYVTATVGAGDLTIVEDE